MHFTTQELEDMLEAVTAQVDYYARFPLSHQGLEVQERRLRALKAKLTYLLSPKP